MNSDQKELFARAVLLGQRIYLSCQAMLTQVSRSLSGGDFRGQNMKEKIRNSLIDLSSCLQEFEEITEIELGDALVTLNKSLQALDNGETSALYESLQRLYRDDYLGRIIALSK